MSLDDDNDGPRKIFINCEVSKWHSHYHNSISCWSERANRSCGVAMGGEWELWTRRKDNGCPRVALEIILSCRDATPETYSRINNFHLFGFGILWCTLRISENVIEKDEREEIREENICFARSRFDKNQREIGPKSPIRENRDTVSEIVITFHCLWSRGSLSIDLFNSVKIIQEMLKSEFSLKETFVNIKSANYRDFIIYIRKSFCAINVIISGNNNSEYCVPFFGGSLPFTGA